MSRFTGIRRVFRLGAWRKELDDELAFHHAATVEELMGEGKSRAEAEEVAQRRFGSRQRYRRELEEIDGRAAFVGRWAQRWEVFVASVRYAFRRLRRAPLFATGVILTFALGIGANATMFGILDRILLSPPPHVANPDEVRRVLVEQLSPFTGSRLTSGTITYPDFLDLSRVSGFSDIAAISHEDITLGDGLEASSSAAELVTGNYFTLLGVQPALGRLLGPDDDGFGKPGVAVISYGTWQARYGGDREIVGRTMDFGHGPYTIVGVAPRGFAGVEIAPVDVWFPLHVTAPQIRGDASSFENRGSYWLRVIGRVAAGVSDEQVEAQATAAMRSARADDAEGRVDPEPHAVVAPVIAAQGPLASEESTVALMLSAISLIVLLIACANIANLIIARLSREQREVGVRLALGSSRSRLLSQVFVESVLLALLGGIAALLISIWGGGALRAFLLPEVAWDAPGTGLRLGGYVMAVALLAGLCAGLLPAIQAARSSVGDILKSGGRTLSAPAARTRGLLTALQAAICVVLLVAAGLFVRSLDRIGRLDLGFEPEGVLLVMPEFEPGTPPERRPLFYREAAERLGRLPFVEAVSPDISVPFSTQRMAGVQASDGDSIPRGQPPIVHAVAGSYFGLMGLEIRRGRGFLPTDVAGAPNAVVLSESMANVLWPGEEALGRCVELGMPMEERGCTEVVGVVENSYQSSLMDDDALHVYIPLEQQFARDTPNALFVKVEGDEGEAISQIRRELLAVDPTPRYAMIAPLTDLVADEAGAWRLGAALFSIFGLLALIVGGVGLYSVLAYGIAQRTFEIGIRTALGARRRQLVTALLGTGVALAGLGVLAGLGITLLLAPQLEPVLFQVSPRDPLTLTAVVLILMAVAILASALPAYRATRVDPAVALRAD